VTRREVVVENELGLHLRSAGAFVRTASRFKSQIQVGTFEVPPVDGKSILGLVTLGAAPGVTLVITAEGPDEAEAVTALVGLVSAHFGE
jgi:phosphotransferase system HPr (HPr) family protein